MQKVISNEKLPISNKTFVWKFFEWSFTGLKGFFPGVISLQKCCCAIILIFPRVFPPRFPGILWDYGWNMSSVCWCFGTRAPNQRPKSCHHLRKGLCPKCGCSKSSCSKPFPRSSWICTPEQPEPLEPHLGWLRVRNVPQIPNWDFSQLDFHGFSSLF